MQGLSYSFQPTKALFIYSTTNPSGTKVEDVVYKELVRPLTQVERDRFLVLNSDSHITYYGDFLEFDQSFDWDGKGSVKRLGKEKNLIVKSHYNWTHQIICKDTDNGFFQVRTKAQFDLEQKFIKSRRRSA